MIIEYCVGPLHYHKYCSAILRAAYKVKGHAGVKNFRQFKQKRFCAFIPLNSFYKCWAQTFEHKGIGKMSTLLGKSNKATLRAPKK